MNSNQEAVGCLARVCPPPREVVLVALQQVDGLAGLAILDGGLQHGHGLAHVVRPPLVHRQDCTHWCAPGMSDALALVVLNLIDLYGGNRSAFVDAMLATTDGPQHPALLAATNGPIKEGRRQGLQHQGLQHENRSSGALDSAK